MREIYGLQFFEDDRSQHAHGVRIIYIQSEISQHSRPFIWYGNTRTEDILLQRQTLRKPYLGLHYTFSRKRPNNVEVFSLMPAGQGRDHLLKTRLGYPCVNLKFKANSPTICL